MELTIYRENWRRGGDSPELCDRFGSTTLLDPKHMMMCCLGQCAIQLGSCLADIAGIAEPEGVDNKEPLIGVLVYMDDEDFGHLRTTSLTREAMAINDDGDLSDAQRESELAKIFKAKQGHTLRFVDGPAPWITTA